MRQPRFMLPGAAIVLLLIMVVCKFFAEGNCKYGSRCRFEHPIDSYGGYDNERSTDDRSVGTSILKKSTNTSNTFGRQAFDQGFTQNQQVFSQTFNQSPQAYPQSNFTQNPHNFSQQSFTQSTQGFAPSPQQNRTPGMKVNVHDLMSIVSKDITAAEKGNQWQLSCYSPLKDLCNFPGLEDHSTEELRWECYKALQNGTLQLCQALVQQLFANVAKINNDLKKKDTGYVMIDRWVREGVINSQPSNQNVFSGDPTSGFTNTAPLFPSPENQPAVNSSAFSFSLPPQQTMQPQPFPVGASVLGVQSSPNILPVAASNQSTQLFPSSHLTVVSVSDSQAYSAAEDLTEAELEAFKSDRFVFGSIPTKPPPKTLCR